MRWSMRATSETRIVNFISILAEASESGYVSGQALAKGAKISRSAVWKQIRMLRRFGYGIDSVHGRGYKLVRRTNLPVPWELKRILKTSVIGKRIIYRDLVDSTQGIALAIANKNSPSDGTVVIAEEQKGGRGRMKRKWISPSGGLWLSIIVHPDMHPRNMPVLPFAAALAVREAISRLTQLKVGLKWPNDIMISGRKVAGILLDISAEADTINYAIVGIGINANVDPTAIARSIEDSQEITSLLAESGLEVSRLDLAAHVIEQIEKYLEIARKDGIGAILTEWKKYADMIGKNATISQGNKVIHKGIAMDVDSDGSLVLRLANGEKVTVTTGDVRIRY